MVILPTMPQWPMVFQGKPSSSSTDPTTQVKDIIDYKPPWEAFCTQRCGLYQAVVCAHVVNLGSPTEIQQSLISHQTPLESLRLILKLFFWLVIHPEWIP